MRRLAHTTCPRGTWRGAPAKVVREAAAGFGGATRLRAQTPRTRKNLSTIPTDDAAAGVPAPMTTAAAVALATVQDAAAVPEPGVASTRALHAKPGMKLVPVTVMVLPATRTRARWTWPRRRGNNRKRGSSDRRGSRTVRERHFNRRRGAFLLAGSFMNVPSLVDLP